MVRNLVVDYSFRERSESVKIWYAKLGIYFAVSRDSHTQGVVITNIL